MNNPQPQSYRPNQNRPQRGRGRGRRPRPNRSSHPSPRTNSRQQPPNQWRGRGRGRGGQMRGPMRGPNPRDALLAIITAEKDDFQAFRMILDDCHGISPSLATDMFFKTCKFNAKECARILLNDFNADVTQINKRTGYTPLHSAAYYGHLSMVKLILGSTRGFNIEKNQHGETPIDAARTAGHEAVALHMENFDRPLEKSVSTANRKSFFKRALPPAEQAKRTTQSVLNKMTRDNFEKLQNKLLDLLEIQKQYAQKMAEAIVKKAEEEEGFGDLYSLLCYKMVKDLPSMKELILREWELRFLVLIGQISASPETVDAILEVTESFEDEKKIPTDLVKLIAEFAAPVSGMTDDPEDRRKRLLKGNVLFLGELFRRGLISNEMILPKLFTLLRRGEIDCICRFLTANGIVVSRRGVDLLTLVTHTQEQCGTHCEPRVKFMIQDLLALTKRWKQVKPQPVPTANVHFYYQPPPYFEDRGLQHIQEPTKPPTQVSPKPVPYKRNRKPQDHQPDQVMQLPSTPSTTPEKTRKRREVMNGRRLVDRKVVKQTERSSQPSQQLPPKPVTTSTIAEPEPAPAKKERRPSIPRMQPKGRRPSIPRMQPKGRRKIVESKDVQKSTLNPHAREWDPANQSLPPIGTSQDQRQGGANGASSGVPDDWTEYKYKRRPQRKYRRQSQDSGWQPRFPPASPGQKGHPAPPRNQRHTSDSSKRAHRDSNTSARRGRGGQRGMRGGQRPQHQPARDQRNSSHQRQDRQSGRVPQGLPADEDGWETVGHTKKKGRKHFTD